MNRHRNGGPRLSALKTTVLFCTATLASLALLSTFAFVQLRGPLLDDWTVSLTGGALYVYKTKTPKPAIMITTWSLQIVQMARWPFVLPRRLSSQVLVEVILPLYLLIIPLGFLAFCWRRKGRISSKLPGNQNCRTCGYDLRGSSELCPECGTHIEPSCTDGNSRNIKTWMRLRWTEWTGIAISISALALSYGTELRTKLSDGTTIFCRSGLMGIEWRTCELPYSWFKSGFTTDIEDGFVWLVIGPERWAARMPGMFPLIIVTTWILLKRSTWMKFLFPRAEKGRTHRGLKRGRSSKLWS